MTLKQRSSDVPLQELYRYNWRAPSAQSEQPSQSVQGLTEGAVYSTPESCLPITISTTITLTLNTPPATVLYPQNITYTPSCTYQESLTGFSVPSGTATNKTLSSDDNVSNVPSSSLREPFYASTIPMAYSIAMTITLSYILLFLLFLSTPRPWLQKVATLTVVICLTIAFAETTDLLAELYSRKGETWESDTENGSAKEIREEVVGGTPLRVGRIISDTFLWLAQIQTLIRLFPRHREKIIIKWAGAALIVLDTIFAILVQFFAPTTRMSLESFMDAIPALSYLFQIVLSLLYAACVLYYSMSSRIRRFAYYHPKAPNNVLIALLSIICILIPMIFFCLDIGQKDLAAWGDYVRWVGAAAASVVVWEWVDRIERLEREERREGVLGREIYDGDDGLVEDMGVPQDDNSMPGSPSISKGSGGTAIGAQEQGSSGTGSEGGFTSGARTKDLSHLATGSIQRHRSNQESPLGRVVSPSSSTGSPDVSSYGTRRASLDVPNYSTLRASSATPGTTNSSETSGRRSVVSFVGLRDTRHTARSTARSERSNLTFDSGADLGTRVDQISERAGADGGFAAGNLDPSEPIRTSPSDQSDRGDLEFTESLSSFVEKSPASSAKQGQTLLGSSRTWRSLGLFKRGGSETHAEAGSDSDREPSTWSSLLSGVSSGIRSAINSSPTLSFTAAVTSSSGDLREERNADLYASGTRKRPLPVTVIPAPPRGSRISLRELEEARKNGIGDEHVGVWTGNKLRSNQKVTTVPESSISGLRAIEGEVQKDLPDHKPNEAWNPQNEGAPSYPYHQQAQTYSPGNSAPLSTLSTTSLPPLPPSPATGSSCLGEGQYHYSGRQTPNRPGSTVSTSPDRKLGSGGGYQSTPSTALGASPGTREDSVTTIGVGRTFPGSISITGRPSSVSLSRARATSTISALGVVEERVVMPNDHTDGCESGEARPPVST